MPEKVRELVALMRELGMTEYQDASVRIVLGSKPVSTQVLAPPSETEKKPPTGPMARLNPNYSDPALWGQFDHKNGQ